jgi:hypothetical protein
MSQTITGRSHARGRGWIYLGLAVSGTALFWLAKKAGWLGVGRSGLFWPLPILGLGMAIIAGGRLHIHGSHHRQTFDPKGGRS